ncbi:MAG TPA: Imm26 family immunity protein [Phycisphaerales bacterium]|nr:Imm26 family immunity protein [Phycisphaerales bacterium]
MARPQRAKTPAPTLTPHEHLNMMVIRRSRHQPEPGDLFALNMRGERWVIGRVINNNAVGLAPGANLLYFYRMEVKDPLDPTAITTPITPDLLIPPTITNDRGWTTGFYLHLRNAPLQPQELLPRHVFKSVLFPEDDPRSFVDEYQKQTPPPEPGLIIGRAGLASYSIIDVYLSRALGIPEPKDPGGPWP